jgi:hypothetical protein
MIDMHGDHGRRLCGLNVINNVKMGKRFLYTSEAFNSYKYV